MSKSILVIGGTGQQGSALASELLRRGHKVHIFTREPSSPVPQELSGRGAIIHAGNLDDINVLRSAAQNVDGVFLVLRALGSEVFHATNVIQAAKEAGVIHMVYTSVARTGDHENFPRWRKDYPLADYWLNKALIEDRIRSAGFVHWTIMQPAFFVQNFDKPYTDYMFPGLTDKKELVVAYKPHTRLDLIHLTDIARLCADAFDLPSKYSGKTIPLAAESLTIDEIVQILSNSSHGPIKAKYRTAEEAQKLEDEGDLIIASQIWQRDVGYGVDLQELKQYDDAHLITFAETVARGGLKW
ncbi:hypothetical protein BKA67DRAFT_588700 [Truncatella angustata]|uniref:NmrA-like domain-containing protein n=1 Tax=Truncatella angustata TaxID=152316 RepID=A0A9P8RDY9_9PEZI|nr:uncharacterized protein BKA67DRAFT_588700 [Truncatella angustata]KAH6638515.1 hypothetical protein BKA67DRAFT_588700 [Truncatella angustata]KAH8197078.1 hypothetical protein TruAng_008748 [Truncatella angustata]